MSELLTNAFADAFPANRSGVITLAVRGRRDAAVIEVGDDGVGLPGDVRLGVGGTGMRQIEPLAEQAQAQTEVSPGRGTQFLIGMGLED